MTVPRRKRQRLIDFDYAQPGAYFVTMSARGGACLFGEIIDGTMHLSSAGRTVDEAWRALPARFAGIALDQSVTMPNHLHGIVVIDTPDGPGLPAIIGAFKSATTRMGNEQRGTRGAALWHRGYYDHVIRNDFDLDRVREYIAGNPAKWDRDEANPANRSR